MRKHLMAGTALAAAAMLAAGGAAAQDKKSMKPSISVNGYYEGVVGGIVDDSQETKFSYMGVANGGTAPDLTQTAWDDTLAMTKRDDKADTSALDTRTDAEIHFNGRATLDSGMKIHARVELEGQNHHSQSGDPIDEYFLSVSGSFGRIILGGTGGAPVKILIGLIGLWATGVGETLSFDNSWIPSAAGGPAHFYRLQHSRLDTGDAEKITYISPKLGGFQVGLTYSPNMMNNDDNSRVDTANGPHDGIEGAVSYTGKFGDVGFGIGGGMTSYQGADGEKDDGRSDWLLAGRIDFGGGFRVAIGHKRVTDDNEMMESQLTDAGVRFVQGANSFSLVGSHGEMENTDAAHTAVMASYARALGPGVKWHANVIWNKSQSPMSMTPLNAAAGSEGGVLAEAPATGTEYVSRMNESENSGAAIVTGIKVVF